MKLTREEKKTASKELATVLKGASTIFFTGYQGLKFVEIDGLRKQGLKDTRRLLV